MAEYLTPRCAPKHTKGASSDTSGSLAQSHDPQSHFGLDHDRNQAAAQCNTGGTGSQPSVIATKNGHRNTDFSRADTALENGICTNADSHSHDHSHGHLEHPGYYSFRPTAHGSARSMASFAERAFTVRRVL
jgi:hypothetical protein